jgi:hypothetical protein
MRHLCDKQMPAIWQTLLSIFIRDVFYNGYFNFLSASKSHKNLNSLDFVTKKLVDECVKHVHFINLQSEFI